MDSDDKIGPDYLSKAVKILDSRSDVKIVFAEAEYFGDKQGPMELYYNRRDMNEFTVDHILLSNFVYCACLYRRIDYEQAGGYNINMKYGWEDWDFLLSMLSNGGIIYKLPDVHFYYRVRNQSMLNTLDIEKKEKLLLQLYTNHQILYNKLFSNPITLYKQKIETERQLQLIKNSRTYKLSNKLSFIFNIIRKAGFPRIPNKLNHIILIF